MKEPICDIRNCSGCGACAGVCPKHCITLASDKYKDGHIYPVIAQDACIDCGLCVRTCPANNPVDLRRPSSCIASYVENEEECIKSSSGGLAYAICRDTIINGGVVYGVVIDYGQEFSINHQRIDTIDKLAMTQGSKYVQSHISADIYHSLKDDVTSGRRVVFVGTGCQIAAVRNFLRKDYDNLLTVDIVCHGVPSQAILRSYLDANNYIPSQIKELTFRTKDNFGVYGVYGVYGVRIDKPQRKSSYIMGFMKGIFYRDSCYNCRYATSERCSDITLGDFWGLKRSINKAGRKYRGTSLVLLNTNKGNSYFDRIKSDLVWEIRPIDEAVAGNPQLQAPSQRHYAYGLFKFLYPRLGYRITAAITLVREKLFYDLILPGYYKYCEPLFFKLKKL